MFRKPYKIKTSTTVKGSDRRKLRSMVENQFPSISIEDLNSLIPNKGEINQVKALMHSGTIAMIFYSGPNPIFFQIWDTCYPTLYTLWKYPNLLPILTILPAVPEKIANGADLMAPGIIITESTISEMRDLKVKEICSLKVMGNRSPMAVGTAMMSAEELCVEGVKGKAVSIVHTYKDTMYLSGDQQAIPFLPELEIEELSEEINDIDISNKESSSLEVTTSVETPVDNSTAIESDESALPANIPAEKDKIPNYSMDEILLQSFLAAVKFLSKKITLPVLTSTFYSTYVLKSCPPELNLDIKKTTYKKLSVFLKKMQKEGVIQIKELTKGVESIISINIGSEAVMSYCLDPLFKKYLKEKKEKTVEEMPSDTIQASYKFPCVTELFVVSAQVKQLFATYQIRKGDTVTPASVRDVVKRYAKENSLQNEHNPKEVILDPILTDCISKKGETRTVMTWEELYEAITSRMTHAYQIEFEDKETIIRKGKLEPILVTVDTRTGNKKVTLIQNLETYGIKPENLAHHVQVAVAASSTITPTQNGKGNLVLIQGNQVRYLQKLFLEIYKVPRKYLQGLETASKKK